MKTRTAPTLAALLLATVTIIGLVAGGDAVAADLRGRALDVEIENSIDADIAINDLSIGRIESNSSDIVVTAIDLAEIGLNINEEDSVQSITNINNIEEIAIAGRIGRIAGLDDLGLISLAEVSLIGGADGADISATI